MKKVYHFWGCGGIATLAGDPKPQPHEGPWAVVITALNCGQPSTPLLCTEACVQVSAFNTINFCNTLLCMSTHNTGTKNKPHLCCRGESVIGQHRLSLWAAGQPATIFRHSLFSAIISLGCWPTVNHPFLAQVTGTWGTF